MLFLEDLDVSKTDLPVRLLCSAFPAQASLDTI